VKKNTMFVIFFLAVFLQSGAYGLTFMLPRLFDGLGSNEKAVGTMLMFTALATLASVYYVGHLSDVIGRVKMLALGCIAIATALALYAVAESVSGVIFTASVLLGFGWGITYALCPVVLTKLVPNELRIKFFTLLSIAVMAGFGLSPVLAAVLQSFGLSLNIAFYVTSVFCIISAATFWLIDQPIKNHSTVDNAPQKSKITLNNVKAVFKSPAWRPLTMVLLGASVFAGVTNFQTVYADERELTYSDYFLIYTITVVVFRFVLARFSGGKNPYLTIALLQFLMGGSVIFFCFISGNDYTYWLFAVLFGIGYGVSYPILVAMAAKDADKDLVAQTLQLFAFSYFAGIFGFPLVAGWMIVEIGSTVLLTLIALLAVIEASLALRRAIMVETKVQ
jgi:MFS family permease